MLNLEKARKIDGWMNEPGLVWLAERASEHNTVVEIGSWYGRSTRAMADNAKGVVYAVDIWDGTGATANYVKGDLYAGFVENLKDLILAGKVLTLRMASVSGAKSAATLGLKFDMIFIDADHEYESVKQDILAWKPLLNSGGLFCGHDYDWPGVKAAVKEFVGPVEVVKDETIWWTHV